jgi:hypothetical protein
LTCIKRTHLGCDFPPITNVEPLRESDLQRLSELQRWIDIRVAMQELKTKTNEDQGGTWTTIKDTPSDIHDLHISAYYIIFWHGCKEDKHYYVFDYDQVMMVCDTISARVFSLWYNNTLPDSAPGKISENVLIELYTIFDKCLTDLGNKAYRQICFLEPACLATMLDRHESVRRSGDFLSWLKTTAQGEHHTYLQQVLLLLDTHELDCCGLSELHGLFRHWGHPTVHEELGCEKTRVIGRTRSFPNLKVQRLMVGLMKRQFYVSFLSIHGRPPKVTNLTFFKGKPMYFLLQSKPDVINLYSPAYPLEDWGFVDYGKEFEFDYNLDYTELMDDKALSPIRSELRTAFNPERLGYNPGRPTTSRRVLEEVLRRDTVDVKGICEQIQTGQNFWWIFVLSGLFIISISLVMLQLL